jgi:hypothetical protein
MRPEYLIPALIASATFLGTLAVVVVGFIYNNGRMTDLRNHLDARLNDHYHAFSTRLDDFHADLTRIKDHLNLK